MKMLFACMAFVLIGCSNADYDTAFDRPALLALAAPNIHADLQNAERHILVVRHARKISEDCNALPCPLSPLGEQMVARLREIIGEPAVDMALSSAACRTKFTAAAGGRKVEVHQAGDGMAQGCVDGAVISRTRAQAISIARNTDARWSIVGEHSNTVCTWLMEFTTKSEAENAGCVDNRLPSKAYGHVYWLYQLQGEWRLAVLSEAFEI